MITSLANVSVPVRDYDEAIRWYTETLGLELRMDGSMGGDYRFVTVGVKGQSEVSIVLHRTLDNPAQPSTVIHSLLFHTDDCRGDTERLRAHGVRITLEPQDQPWGTQAVLEDLYGNSIVMLQPSPMALGQAPPSRHTNRSHPDGTLVPVDETASEPRVAVIDTKGNPGYNAGSMGRLSELGRNLVGEQAHIVGFPHLRTSGPLGEVDRTQVQGPRSSRGSGRDD